MQAEEGAVLQAQAEAERSRLKYESQFEGVNTTVASATAQMKEGEGAQKQAAATVESLKAQLELARYYLDNTLMVARESPGAAGDGCRDLSCRRDRLLHRR
jgi:hypothetical protein